MSDDAPRPGHKYRSRKRHNGRWVYDYGKGFPAGTEDANGPSDAALRAALALQTKAPSGFHASPAKVAAAVDRAVARMKEDQRRREQTSLFPSAKTEPPKAASPMPSPASVKAIKPPGSREELMQQVKAIGKWTGSTLVADTAQFSRDTGFQVTAVEPGKRAGPNRLRAAKGTAVCLLAVRHLVNVVPEMSTRLKVNVIANGKTAQATYSSGTRTFARGPFGSRRVLSESAHNLITVHDRDAGHSVLHEFGHYLDHYLGNPDEANAYATGKRGSALHDFVVKAVQTESGQAWGEQNKHKDIIFDGVKTSRSALPYHILVRLQHKERNYLRYIHEPSEIVARFFDCWAHWKLNQKGFDTAALGIKSDYKVGGYSDADIEKLAPLFEKALGDKLAKSVLAALQDLAWLARGRAAPLLS